MAVAQDLYIAGTITDIPIVSPLYQVEATTLTAGTYGSVAMTIDAAGTTAYVLDAHSRLLVIDIPSHVITHTIVLGGSSTGSGNVKLNNGETVVYVNDSTLGSTWAIDIASLTIIASGVIYPQVIAPGDTTGYSSGTTGHVNVIDLGTDTVMGTIALSHPTGTAAGLWVTANFLYIIDGTSSVLDIYEFSSTSIVATVTGFTHAPHNFVVNAAETLAFVGTGGGPAALNVVDLTSVTIIHTTTLSNEFVFVMALDAAEDYLAIGYFDWPNIQIVNATTYAVLSGTTIPISGFSRAFAFGRGYPLNQIMMSP